MDRLLLLIPTTSYRTHDFMAAAARLDVELIVGSDDPPVLAEAAGRGLKVDLADIDRGTADILAFAEHRPLAAIIGVDDGANAVAAAAASALGIKGARLDGVMNAKNKHRFRQRLAAADCAGPAFRLIALDDDPARVARELDFPVVIKPLSLSMSRGVIRADGHNSFVAAFHRAADIVRGPDADTPGEAADHLLIESYVPGREYAIEGLIEDGRLHLLALFDKPEAPEGPFFEETIYVSPASVDAGVLTAIEAAAQGAIAAIGLRDGPAHIDLRVNDGVVVILEADARSIGGH